MRFVCPHCGQYDIEISQEVDMFKAISMLNYHSAMNHRYEKKTRCGLRTFVPKIDASNVIVIKN